MAKDPITQSRVLENKADQLRTKGKFRQAFDQYTQALELDENRLELYDKMIAVHTEFQDKWTEDDFAINVHLSMRKQEILDPTFKRLHAKHDHEYKDISMLIRKMLDAKDAKTETHCIEAIREFGDLAIYPLVDFLLGFKEVTLKKKKKS